MTPIPSHSPSQRAAQTSNRSSENSKEIPKEKFEEYMKVAEIDDSPQRSDLFSLIEEEEEEKKEKENLSPTHTYFHNLIAHLDESIHVTEIQKATNQLEILFEKMAAAMIVLSTSLETETTLYLDNPQSLFYGTRITIRDFTTAPRTFNVEIASHSAAVKFLEIHKQELLKSFSEKDFNFSIHRLETQIQNEEERPVFHRKDAEENAQDPGA